MKKVPAILLEDFSKKRQIKMCDCAVVFQINIKQLRYALYAVNDRVLMYVKMPCRMFVVVLVRQISL